MNKKVITDPTAYLSDSDDEREFPHQELKYQSRSTDVDGRLSKLEEMIGFMKSDIKAFKSGYHT